MCGVTSQNIIIWINGMRTTNLKLFCFFYKLYVCNNGIILNTRGSENINYILIPLLKTRNMTWKMCKEKELFKISSKWCKSEDIFDFHLSTVFAEINFSYELWAVNSVSPKTGVLIESSRVIFVLFDCSLN